MVIILPETKIKGRTGWTESVATNSCTAGEGGGGERGAWLAAAWVLQSRPEEGEVGVDRVAWGNSQD